MRKIEELMLHAMAEMKNFKSGNTRVSIESKNVNDNVAIVTLHGNEIAMWHPRMDSLFIYDGGWESVTTKSRLNAILSRFTEGYGIIQRDWHWYIAGPGEHSGDAKRPWTDKAHFVNGHIQSC